MGESPELRVLEKEDAEDVAALFRAAFGADRLIDAQEILEWFDNTELQKEWLRVLEIEGRVVGYGDMMIEEDELALDLAAPDHCEPFFDWAENAAREANLSRVRTFLPAGHELAAFAEKRGYKLWRSAFTMEIEFDETEPEAATLPEGLELRAFRPEDAEVVRVTLNEAFADDPTHHEESPDHFREFFLKKRGFDADLLLLAWEGDELAGFIMNFPGQPGDESLGWVGVLGVRSRWRRRGLGTALLGAAFRALHQRGLRRVGLGVDTENVTGALRIYESVGMRAIRRGDNWVLDL